MSRREEKLIIKLNIMALVYNKEELFKMAEKAIKENNLFFIYDIIAWLPCSHDTFYTYFPVGSDELDILKRMLDDNKVRTKSAIRAKLFKSEKAGELLALYRLICTPEERRMLNQSYLEVESNKSNINITFVDEKGDEDKG